MAPRKYLKPLTLNVAILFLGFNMTIYMLDEGDFINYFGKYKIENIYSNRDGYNLLAGIITNSYEQSYNIPWTFVECDDGVFSNNCGTGSTIYYDIRELDLIKPAKSAKFLA